MKKQDFILPCSLGCMIYGIWISFCEIFECSVDRGAYLLPAFVIAGVVVCLLMSWRWRVTFGILGAGALAIFLYSMKNFQRLSMEADRILFYIDLRSQEYYGVDFFHTYRQRGNMDDTIIWILLGIAFGIFITLFAFRLNNFQYGFLPCYLILAVGLFLGRTPGIRGTLYMLLGILLAMFWRSGREYGGRTHFYMMKVKKRGKSWRRYPVFFLALVCVLAAAAQLAGDREERLFAHNRNVQETQTRLERKVLQAATEVSKYIRGTLSIDSNGKLNNDEPKYAKRPVLEITVSARPRSDIYLKGFVGSRYSQGEWKTEDVEAFQELFPDSDSRSELASLGKSMMEDWVEDLNFLAVEDDLPPASAPREQQMHIEHVGRGRWSSYTYIPYFADLDMITDTNSEEYLEEQNLDFLDRDSTRVKVSSSYDINFMALTYYDSRIFYNTRLNDDVYGEEGIDYSVMAGRPLRGDKKELQKYLGHYAEWTDDTMIHYLEYAWKEYGFRNESSFFAQEEFINKLQQYNDDYRVGNKTRNMDAMDRVEFVQKLLKEEASYSKALEEVPAGEDYAEYFLLQQKKGFCEHFATAGTLLMRELGIPSRYVGGYKIPMKRFEQNEDGTYTAKVLDSDAHAWTEILAGPMGWFPADMTPAASSGTTKEKSPSSARTPVTPIPKQQEEGEETSRPTVSPAPAVTPAATSAAAGKKGNTAEEGHSAGAGLPGRVAIGFGVILAAAGLWLLGWRIYYASRKKRLLHARGESRSMYVRMRLHDLLFYMRNCGVAVSVHMPEGQWLPVIERLCGQQIASGERFSPEEREEFLRIVQKAAFSSEEVTPEEYDIFRNVCGRLEAAAEKKAGKVRRVYLKLTGRYGKI